VYCLRIPDTGRQYGLATSECIIICKLITGRTQPCCTGELQNPAVLRSYLAQYCNSFPQIFVVVYRLVMNQENWKCIACTSNSLLFNGYRGSLPGLKWPGRKVDHSPPSSSAPSPICFHGVDRGKFIFSLPAMFTVYVAFRSSRERGAKLTIHVYQCHGYELMKLYIQCSICSQLRCFVKHRALLL